MAKIRVKPTKRPTRHHRIAVVNGGTDAPSNISIVPEDQHQAYHFLFKTMSPEELIFEFNKNYSHGDLSELSQKKQNAFFVLWGNKGIKKIVQDLNDRWIDPNFKIKIVRKPFLILNYENEKQTKSTKRG